jgi:bifunctional non-homologous end joining protein LigD
VPKPPPGPDWIHEIKHDGYRLMARKVAGCLQLFTRRGYDWTDRYPAIAAAANALRATSFTIDGEAVVEDTKGVADFQLLHRRGNNERAVLYAFDLLELNGEDLRPLPLIKRKAKLRTLLRRPSAIAYVEHLEGDGAQIFAHACRMGLEGIVSKRADSPYRSGKSYDWLKTKNPDSPAMKRYAEGTF